MSSYRDLFRVRTITCFLPLTESDFRRQDGDAAPVQQKIEEAAEFLKESQAKLTNAGYTVQTVRIATNPFGKWLFSAGVNEEREHDGDTTPSSCSSIINERLSLLDDLLEQHGVQFCALGPAVTVEELPYCVQIVQHSAKFSCSANLVQNDSDMAMQCAATVQQISVLGGGGVDNNNSDAPSPSQHVRGGLGNFRFCVAAAAQAHIPFFPVAKNDDASFRFAIGLENGVLANRLLNECGSLNAVTTTFRSGMAQALEPLQRLCEEIEQEGSTRFQFAGIDTSLNPSLDDGGSIATAIEALDEVQTFGGPGTLAAAATITQCLQSLPGIRSCGYSGLMLPLCEDERLAKLASSSASPQPPLQISQLLSISQVCGVGVDTVPVPGAVDQKELASLLLDVAGIAHRWNKSLSCRVFPVPGKKAGDWTAFDSPYLINSRILSLTPSSS